MKPKREQAMVGIFVIVAGALLVVTVLVISGSMGRARIPITPTFPMPVAWSPARRCATPAARKSAAWNACA